MWGFGEPDAFGSATTNKAPTLNSYGWGFGDPDTASVTTGSGTSTIQLSVHLYYDWGFGDVPKFADAVTVPMLLSPAIVPDNGGIIVAIHGDWPTFGPYYIQLQHTVTEKTFPTNQVFCNSLPGVGTACAPPAKPLAEGVEPSPSDYLRFTVPQLLPGVYDVRIYHVDQPLEPVKVVDEALRVEWRMRTHITYRLRFSLSGWFEAGVRDPAVEKRLPGGGVL